MQLLNVTVSRKDDLDIDTDRSCSFPGFMMHLSHKKNDWSKKTVSGFFPHC